MFEIDVFMLVGGTLLLLGIGSGKFSASIGLPVLVLFLGIGMLAGSEGMGGIVFQNYALSHGIGTLALAAILFDGGLRTPLASVRLAWKPALALSTGGVLLTSAAIGWVASAVLGLPVLHGALLGSIIGSTDAAAVFSVLQSSGLRIRDRLAATLEIESGSNDPMAVFLTVGLLQILLGRIEVGADLLWLLVMQVGIGTIVGLGVGRGTALIVNRINLEAAGLYPILVAASGILSYGLAASLGGSGFLSVYLSGIVLGNSRIVFRRGILYFQDAAAWLGQIVLFIMLGLLSFPSRLLPVAGSGLLIALVLTLVVRPLVVWLVLLPFRFKVREIAFLSWGGLKGAVPITLATYPLMFGLPGADLLFNVVFFVVLVSAVSQGWTLPFLAKRLNLVVPAGPEPPITLEIGSLRSVESDVVEYTVHPEALAANRLLRDIPLPERIVVALLVRDREAIAPRGNTVVIPGDRVFLVLHEDMRPVISRLFGRATDPGEPVLPPGEYVFSGSTTIAQLDAYYGIRLAGPAQRTLEEVLRAGAGAVTPGSRVAVGETALYAREVEQGTAEWVGVVVRAVNSVERDAVTQEDRSPG